MLDRIRQQVDDNTARVETLLLRVIEMQKAMNDDLITLTQIALAEMTRLNNSLKQRGATHDGHDQTTAGT